MIVSAWAVLAEPVGADPPPYSDSWQCVLAEGGHVIVGKRTFCGVGLSTTLRVNGTRDGLCEGQHIASYRLWLDLVVKLVEAGRLSAALSAAEYAASASPASHSTGAHRTLSLLRASELKRSAQLFLAVSEYLAVGADAAGVSYDVDALLGAAAAQLVEGPPAEAEAAASLALPCATRERN